jgi:hypothetical protein
MSFETNERRRSIFNITTSPVESLLFPQYKEHENPNWSDDSNQDVRPSFIHRGLPTKLETATFQKFNISQIRNAKQLFTYLLNQRILRLWSRNCSRVQLFTYNLTKECDSEYSQAIKCNLCCNSESPKEPRVLLPPRQPPSR